MEIVFDQEQVQTKIMKRDCFRVSIIYQSEWYNDCHFDGNYSTKVIDLMGPALLWL